MFNKKTILIFISALLFLAIIIYLLSIWKKAPNNPSAPNTPFSNVPYSPAPVPVSTEPTPNHGKITISDPSSSLDIKNSFDNFLTATQNDKTSKNDTQWLVITDKKGSPVSLGAFSTSIGFKINPGISNLLNTNNYNIIYCSDGNKKDYGLVVNVRLFPNNPNIYQDMQRLMKDWEKTLFQDTHSVVFPDITFSQSDLDQKIEFKKGTYRYADILLPDKKQSSINYNIVFDSIIITSTLDCLKKASLNVETLEP